jgi:hypothetical protein
VVWLRGLMFARQSTTWAIWPSLVCVCVCVCVCWAFLRWLQTVILLISASWVASITGESDWCPSPHCHIIEQIWSERQVLNKETQIWICNDNLW